MKCFHDKMSIYHEPKFPCIYTIHEETTSQTSAGHKLICLVCWICVTTHKCEEPWKCSLQTKPDNPQRITLTTTGSVPHTLTNSATRPKDAAEPHSPHTDLVCRDHSGTLVGWPGSISSVLPVDDLQGVPGRCFGLGSCCSALCADTT